MGTSTNDFTISALLLWHIIIKRSKVWSTQVHGSTMAATSPPLSLACQPLTSCTPFISQYHPFSLVFPNKYDETPAIAAIKYNPVFDHN
jgi:hypothetical protein